MMVSSISYVGQDLSSYEFGHREKCKVQLWENQSDIFAMFTSNKKGCVKTENKGISIFFPSSSLTYVIFNLLANFSVEKQKMNFLKFLKCLNSLTIVITRNIKSFSTFLTVILTSAIVRTAICFHCSVCGGRMSNFCTVHFSYMAYPTQPPCIMSKVVLSSCHQLSMHLFLHTFFKARIFDDWSYFIFHNFRSFSSTEGFHGNDVLAIYIYDF